MRRPRFADALNSIWNQIPVSRPHFHVPAHFCATCRSNENLENFDGL